MWLCMWHANVVSAPWTGDQMMPGEPASATVSGHSSPESVWGQAAPLPEGSEGSMVAVVCNGVLGGLLLWGSRKAGPVDGLTGWDQVVQEVRAAGLSLKG